MIVKNSNCGSGSVETSHHATVPASSSFHAEFSTPLVIDVAAPKIMCFGANSGMTLDAVGFYL